MLPKAAKVQGYSFYPFWVIKGKPTGFSRLWLILRTSWRWHFSIISASKLGKTFGILHNTWIKKCMLLTLVSKLLIFHCDLSDWVLLP